MPSRSFSHELPHSGKNDELLPDVLEIGGRLPGDQLINHLLRRGTAMRGEKGGEAAFIVIPQIFAVIFFLAEKESELTQDPLKDRKVDRFAVRDDTVEVENHRTQQGSLVKTRARVSEARSDRRDA